MEPQAECMLVLIGATPEGQEELLGFQVGMRESTQSWRELLGRHESARSRHRAGVGDRRWHSCFWRALEEASPSTRHHCCTVHKTANVLDKLPTSVQPSAKRDLRQIWTAPDRKSAYMAITLFAEKYGTKYEQAVTALNQPDFRTISEFRRRHTWTRWRRSSCRCWFCANAPVWSGLVTSPWTTKLRASASKQSARMWFAALTLQSR